MLYVRILWEENQMELDFTVTNEWKGLSDQEKQQRLYSKQKNVLDTFLER